MRIISSIAENGKSVHNNDIRNSSTSVDLIDLLTYLNCCIAFYGTILGIKKAAKSMVLCIKYDDPNIIKEPYPSVSLETLDPSISVLLNPLLF